MTAQELNTYIDKVLGNSLRCLLPSYWWRRVLKLVVEYVEKQINNVNVKADNGNSKANEALSKVGEIENNVNTLEGKANGYDTILKKLVTSTFVVTTKSEGGVNVWADGERIYIPKDSTKTIEFTYQFRVDWGENIKSISFANAKTVLNESMEDMFDYCRSLTSLNVSNFDTSNVTNMHNMFYFCDSLTSLDVSNFNTFNVTNMRGMFSSCNSLTSLNVSNFDTSNVTDMGNMFLGCNSLTSLDLSNFDTSNVTDMEYMFSGCKSLISLDIYSFDTSAIVEKIEDGHAYSGLTSMFELCDNLVTLTLGQNFFKMQNLVNGVNFSSLANWSAESAIPSLVTNSYDRTANGLANITLKLHANTYAHLTDEHKASLTAKGYDVVQV